NLLFQGLEAAVTAKDPLPAFFWPHLVEVTGNTFLLGFLTTAISLLIALPLAFVLARTDIFSSRFWLSLLTVPLIAPPFIMAFATMLLYGRSGVLSILLQNIGINTPHIFGLPGLVLTQLTVSIPYATFIIAAGLQGVPRHIEETAASMGVPPLRIWTDIVLPCVYPHLIISGLMIFLMSVGDVGSPLIIGGGFSVISSEIYTSFLSLLNDDRIALIFSLWIIILSFIMLSIVNLLLRYTVKQYRTGTHPVIYRLSGLRLPVTIFSSLIILWLLLPFLMIVVHSFGAIWTYELSPRNWTGEYYLQMLKAPSLLKDTLSLALIATPILVIFGLILGHRMYLKKEWRFLNFIMIIPFVLPGVVIAVGVLQSYAGMFTGSRAIPFYALLILTIIMRRLPYSLKTLEAGFLTADPRREEVAKSLGSNQITSFVLVTLPQMKPFVFAALIIGLIKTATELSASLIMAPPNWQSLSLGIVYFIEQGQLSRASAMSVMLVAVIGAGTFAAAYWSQSSRNSFTGDSGDALERLVLGRAPVSFPRIRKKRKRVHITFWRRREPLLGVDDKSGIIEANRAFLHLVGADSLAHLQAETSFSVLFFCDHQVLEIFSSGEAFENRATSMMILNGERVPVILHAYVLTNQAGDRKVMLYCRKVSGRTRRIREYSRLRERMTAAEQTALKAQIT
ncbi:MAG: ABC transporter permease subunit, partial [Spirochaetales bacterium]|nr:ABC transporter permease subunit [Spirochaetales bacterium]